MVFDSGEFGSNTAENTSTPESENVSHVQWGQM